MTLMRFAGYVSGRTGTARGVELPDVALPGGLRPPSDAITLLYGFNARQEIRYQYQRAKNGELFVPVDVQFESPFTMKRISIGDVAGLNVITLSRVADDFQREIRSRFNKIFGEKGLSVFDDGYATSLMVRRPDMIGALRREPDFAHIAVIIYDVVINPSTEPDRQRFSVASIFAVPQMVEVTPLQAGVDVWFPKRIPIGITAPPGAVPA